MGTFLSAILIHIFGFLPSWCLVGSLTFTCQRLPAEIVFVVLAPFPSTSAIFIKPVILLPATSSVYIHSVRLLQYDHLPSLGPSLRHVQSSKQAHHQSGPQVTTRKFTDSTFSLIGINQLTRVKLHIHSSLVLETNENYSALQTCVFKIQQRSTSCSFLLHDQAFVILMLPVPKCQDLVSDVCLASWFYDMIWIQEP